MTRRLLLLAPSVALLAACGGGEEGGGGAAVRGAFRADQLPGGGDTLYVRVAGSSERVPVVGGGFELAEVGPAAALHFARGDDAVARMEVGELPEGASLELRGIRLDEGSGLAFPASVGLDGAATVMVNGLRYAARPLPEEVRADGRVLAAAGSGDALLVRPADASLPDLRVVVGPLTETVTPDGDPVPADELAAGDSVRVEGRSDGGFLVASRIVAPRTLALREAGEVVGDGDDTREGASGSPGSRGGRARGGCRVPAGGPGGFPGPRRLQGPGRRAPQGAQGRQAGEGQGARQGLTPAPGWGCSTPAPAATGSFPAASRTPPPSGPRAAP